MQDQLKTIRAALDILRGAVGHEENVHTADIALTALTQLEAMVGEQEPVAWQRRMKPVWGDRDYMWSPWEECSEGAAKDCWKTPLLHEWAHEARALYTSVHVGQGARIKEIGEADLDPDEGDPVTLWAEIWRLREAVKGPDGYATWQDAATAERIRRVRAESKHAAPVAQRSQAEPRKADVARTCPFCNEEWVEQPLDTDFTDEWAGYLKDGETPFERFMRERKDLDALTKLYQRVLDENERLQGQQPQAKPHKPLFADLIAQHPGLREELLEMDKQPQAEVVPQKHVWQPIETAPTELLAQYLVYTPGTLYKYDVCRNMNGFRIIGNTFDFDRREQPTMWMPITPAEGL